MKKIFLMFVCALLGSGDALPGLREVAKKYIKNFDENATEEELSEEELRGTLWSMMSNGILGECIGSESEDMLYSCIKEKELELIKFGISQSGRDGAVISALCIEKANKYYPKNDPFLLEMNNYFLDYIEEQKVHSNFTRVDLLRVKRIVQSFGGDWLELALVSCLECLKIKGHIKGWSEGIWLCIQDNTKRLEGKNLKNFLVACVKVKEMDVVLKNINRLDNTFSVQLLETCVKNGQMDFVEEYAKSGAKVTHPMLLQTCVTEDKMDFVEEQIGKLSEFQVMQVLKSCITEGKNEFVMNHIDKIKDKKYLEKLLNHSKEKNNAISDYLNERLKNTEEEKFPTLTELLPLLNESEKKISEELKEKCTTEALNKSNKSSEWKD